MRNLDFCLCKNKGADQRLCFHFTDSTIPPVLMPQNFQILAFCCGCIAWFVINLVGSPKTEMFSWYKYLIVSFVFSHLGFWSGSLFLIAPFPDLCLLVLFLVSPLTFTTATKSHLSSPRYFSLGLQLSPRLPTFQYSVVLFSINVQRLFLGRLLWLPG